MTAPERDRLSTTTHAVEDEQHEAETSESSAPSHPVPVAGVSVGSLPEEDAEESEDEAEDVSTAPRFDARSAMIMQHWRESTGQVGAERRSETGTELSGLRDQRKVSGFGGSTALAAHLRERSGVTGRERQKAVQDDQARMGEQGRVSKKVLPALGPDHEFTKRIGERAKRGALFDPTAHVEQQRAAREAQEALDAKLPSMEKVMTATRAAATAGVQSEDLIAYDAAVTAKNPVAALAALERIERASTAALDKAKDDAVALKEFGKKIGKAPACHQPPNLEALWQGIVKARGAKQWLTIGADVAAFSRVVRQAVGFIDKVAAIRERAGKLKHPGQVDNMTRFLGKHEEMTWDQVVASQHDTRTEGSIAHLEDRLKRYEGNNAAADAAEAAFKEKQDNGLIAGNGTEIERKGVDAFAGEEKTAIEAALKAYDDGTVVALSHPNGMQWAAPHGNRDGDLPGTAGAGGYKEYYVEKKPGSTTYHGDRRLVVHNKKKWVYYSWTHYGDNGSPPFVRLR